MGMGEGAVEFGETTDLWDWPSAIHRRSKEWVEMYFPSAHTNSCRDKWRLYLHTIPQPSTNIHINIEVQELHVEAQLTLHRRKWRELHVKTQSVPRSKRSVSVIQTIQLMLYREIIAVCSEIRTKHINEVCEQNVELYIKTQSVPRSKHTPSRLYKPVS